MAVVPRKTAKRLVGAAAVAGAGGSFYVGLSRADPWSLGVLGGTVVIVVLMLAVTGYKAFDRWLQHLERRPWLPLPRNKRTPARPGPPVHRGETPIGAAREEFTRRAT